MSDYIGVVTNAGQAKIAAAIGGTALNLTTIRVGDGNGAPIVPNPAMLDLVRRVGAAYPIISSGRDPVNASHWRVTALIPVNDGPFDIREIGVWDAAGDMIAVAKHVLVEKRTPAQGAAVELLTDIVFPVSETAQVTVQVTPSAQISIFQMLRAGFMVVESATTTAPPGAPALGRTHVVPPGATGAWNGLAGMLVQWNGIAWVAVDAPVGFHVVDQSKGVDTGARWLERTAAGWAPGVSRLVQAQPGNLATMAGTALALAATLDPPSANYPIGMPLRAVMPFDAADGGTTISLNGGALTGVMLAGGAAIRRGDWLAGQLVEFYRVSGGWQVASPTLRLDELLIFPPGTHTPIVPANVFWMYGEVDPGGPGGGGSYGPGSGGSGGGSGGHAEGWFPTIPGETLTVLCGAGGAGGTGAPTNGSPGTGSSIARPAGANGGTQMYATSGGAGSSGSNAPQTSFYGLPGSAGISPWVKGFAVQGRGGGYAAIVGASVFGGHGAAPFRGSITPPSIGTAGPGGHEYGGGGAGGALGNAGGPGAVGSVSLRWRK